MKTIVHRMKTLNLTFTAAFIFMLLGLFGCSDVYEGPFIPEEEPRTFTGSVGYESVLLTGGKVNALGGLVSLSLGSRLPDQPLEVFVATFPVNHMDLQGYITTGRGYHLELNPGGVGVVIELTYDENHLKSVSDHFHEEDLSIYLIKSNNVATEEEKIIPIGPCELSVERNVISATIYGSGTFVVGTH
jgi:hypothetical protein